MYDCLHFYFAPYRGAEYAYCDDRVCLFATIISGTTCPIFTKFLCKLPMSVARGLPLAALRYIMHFRFYG